MLESTYQARLIKTLRLMFPGCIILKNDSAYQPGIPDLSIFYRNKWAMLEVKPRRNAPQQPNQEYFVELADQMSFGAFIYPENEQEVLDAIQHALAPRRSTRLSQR